MPIYTKKGDRGKTSLFSGKRVWKYDARIEAYGTLDEVNTILGIALATLPQKNNKKIKYLQELILSAEETLFYICSYLADLPDTIDEIDLASKTEYFEKEIDVMTAQMLPLSNFLYHDGTESSAFLQNARAVVRRAERQIVKLAQKEKVDARVVQYVNRLSDLFFTMARYANFAENKKERIWER